MSKKLFFGMFVAAGMLLATSCSKDELETASSGNEAQVTFSLGLEGHIATRAISDGKSADKLVYAVFNENGERISTFQKEEISTSFPATVTLTLAKGQTYKVAFWAQDADCSAYDVDDNMNVKVSYENATNNDETRDAFFKTTEAFTVTGSTSMDVVLKRPFAQINVGVEQTDWTAAVASGVTIQNSSVIIQNAATKINLVTGAVSEPTKVTYSLATIPVEDLKVDVNGDKNIGDGEIYKWLSMSYILVDDESETEGGQDAGKATLEGLKFTFQPENGNEITLEDGLNSVPVQRNWRTNILGKLLTGDITFNISIDEMYEGDYNHVVVSSAQQLTEALADPEITSIVLENDLTGTNVNITSAKEIDLNNNTLQVTYINATAPLTVKNGNLDASNFALRGYANADITLDNVKVTATRNEGNAIELGYINGSDRDCGNAQLTLKDSEINSNGTGILIHGADNKVKIENTVINHKWFGITQNGIVPGSEIELVNCTISGTYSGIYLSNNADGAKNTLKVIGGSIHSDEESAIEVKKTDITVQNATLSSSATEQSYSVNGGGSNGIGYGIVLAGYKVGTAYEGETSFENITYNLSAQGDNVVKILKYNGTEGEKVE